MLHDGDDDMFADVALVSLLHLILKIAVIRQKHLALLRSGVDVLVGIAWWPDGESLPTRRIRSFSKNAVDIGVAVQYDLVRFVRCCKVVLSHHDVEAARQGARRLVGVLAFSYIVIA
jgi:hypothetical protein